MKKIKTIEMKHDGKDSKRFESLLRKVVSVPKEEIKRAEATAKKEQKA